jgi:hypothetical protein
MFAVHDTIVIGEYSVGNPGEFRARRINELTTSTCSQLMLRIRLC